MNSLRNTGCGTVVCLAAAACGCSSRPFGAGAGAMTEVTTGGRTALSKWEFYEALSQMYQAQVMLNIVRLVEYGEAPLHLEFSDITATVTDNAGVGSGFEFFDSPIGFEGVGNVVVPIRDTNVKFTPELSLGRQVVIQAKATPIVRNNWVYAWYYTMADQYTKEEKWAFYKKATALEDFRDRLKIRYRGDTYIVKDDKELKDTGLVPQHELGGLTAILSFLSPSSPMSAGQVEAKLVGDGISDQKLRLEVPERKAFSSSRKVNFLEKVLMEQKPFLPIAIPVEESKPDWTSRLQFDDLTEKGYWQFVIPGDNKADNNKADLEKAITKFRELNEKRLSSGNTPLRIKVTVPIESSGPISASVEARRIAATPELPKSKTDKEIQEDILSTLKRIEVGQK